MKNILVIFSFVVMSLTVYGQTEGLEVKTIDGKEYYQYPVEKGNTLYSISKKFNVDLNEIVSANPDAEKGLDIGQILNIPKASDSSVEVKPIEIQKEKEDDTYIYHKTQQGETLYSISKLYGVKAKELISENPQFETNLPLGSTVKVVKSSIKSRNSDDIEGLEKLPEHPIANANDSLIQHKVEKGETLYSITKQYNISQESLMKFNPSLKDGLKKGDQLIIALPRKKEITQTDIIEDILTEKVTINPINGALNVAVFAPFMLEDYKADRAKCSTNDCEIYKPTLISLNYYHGVQFALDSLKTLGVDVNLYVYDTKKDSSHVRKTLNRKEFETMNLILAPFFEHTLAPVVKFSKTHDVMVVNAVPQDLEVLKGKPNVSNTIPSINTQVEYLGTYVAKNHFSDNVIVMKNNMSKEDKDYYSLFQNNYKTEVVKHENRSSDSARQSYMTTNINDLKLKINKDKLNIIVVPSKDVQYVSNLLTKLNSVANTTAYRDTKIQIYGLGEWLKFTNVDMNYFTRFNTCFTKSSYIDYSKEEVISTINKFRSKYNYDPNKYTFTSYEALLFHAYLMAISKNNFSENYSTTIYKGTHINYHFVKSTETDGFENKNVSIIGFINNRLIKLN